MWGEQTMSSDESECEDGLGESEAEEVYHDKLSMLITMVWLVLIIVRVFAVLQVSEPRINLKVKVFLLILLRMVVHFCHHGISNIVGLPSVLLRKKCFVYIVRLLI